MVYLVLHRVTNSSDTLSIIVVLERANGLVEVMVSG